MAKKSWRLSNTGHSASLTTIGMRCSDFPMRGHGSKTIIPLIFKLNWGVFQMSFCASINAPMMKLQKHSFTFFFV